MSSACDRFTAVFLLVIGIIVHVFPLADASHILVTIPLSSTVSHYLNFREVMRSLTNRQHEVSFLMSISNSAVSNKKHGLYDDDFSFEIYDGLLDQSTMRQHHHNFQKMITKKSSKDNRVIQFSVEAIFDMYNSTANPWHMAAMECDSILGNDTLMAILKSSDYDILFGDPAANLCTPLLAEVLSVPFIQYSVQGPHGATARSVAWSTYLPFLYAYAIFIDVRCHVFWGKNYQYSTLHIWQPSSGEKQCDPLWGS